MNDYPDDSDFDEDAKGCGCADDERCPLCCPCGMYQPGTEECDWCEYSEECESDYLNWCEREKKLMEGE